MPFFYAEGDKGVKGGAGIAVCERRFFIFCQFRVADLLIARGIQHLFSFAEPHLLQLRRVQPQDDGDGGAFAYGERL